MRSTLEEFTADPHALNSMGVKISQILAAAAAFQLLLSSAGGARAGEAW